MAIMIHRKLLFAIIALAVTPIIALITISEGQAHALLVRSDPPINSVLVSTPTTITLFMSEPLHREFSEIQVLNSDGERVDFGNTKFNIEDNTKMRMDVPRLPSDVYTVLWKTLSSIDGHVWNGSYSFTILDETGRGPTSSAFSPDLSRIGPPTAADSAVKSLALLSVLAFLGTMLFTLLAGHPATRRLGAGQASFIRSLNSQTFAIAKISIIMLFLSTAYEALAGAARIGGMGFLDEVLFDSRNGIWLLIRWFLLLAATGALVHSQKKQHKI